MKDSRLPNCVCFALMLIVMICFFTTLAAVEKVTETARVVAESGMVQKINPRSKGRVSNFGMTLEHGDEIITEENGKASILFSMLADTEEVQLMPISRVKFIKEITHENRTIFKIRLLYGKLIVRSMKSRSKMLHIDTELVDARSDEGVFIIESNRQGTTIGTTQGLAQVVVKSTNEEVQLHQHSMVTISHFTSQFTVKNLDNSFLKGIDLVH